MIPPDHAHNSNNRHDHQRQDSPGDRTNRGIGQSLAAEALASGATRVYTGTRQLLAPPAFDRGRYKERNTVERCFSKLKQFRAVVTRYDKCEQIHQGTVDVAPIRIWLRDPVP